MHVHKKEPQRGCREESAYELRRKARGKAVAHGFTLSFQLPKPGENKFPLLEPPEQLENPRKLLQIHTPELAKPHFTSIIFSHWSQDVRVTNSEGSGDPGALVTSSCHGIASRGF